MLNSKNIQTGVFQNFEEFKNNTPQIKGYKLIKKDKGLYWVNSENLKSLKQIYLLSDSIGLFSASEKRISVIRVGNTFEFFSDGLIASSKSIGGSFLNVLSAGSNDRFFNNTNSEFVLIPRQINMETGEVY